MPWKVYQDGDKWCVHKLEGEEQGERVACHDSEAEAQAQMRALYASERDGAKSGLQVYKQADGAYRWLGWVSNQYRDNDNPREILSAASHKEFVGWADRSGTYPELWIWHVPGSKIGKADWLEFADGFLLSSGTFDDAGVAERLAASKDSFTMSHGFVRQKHDRESVVTDAYRMLEASITPQGAEANPWTRFSTTKEVDMPISEAKKAFLSKFLAPEAIAQIEDNTAELRKAAEAAGVDWKEVEAVDAPLAETQPAEAATTATVPDVNAIAEQVLGLVVERLQMKALSDTVAGLQAEAAKVPELQAKVLALETIVKGLKASDDEKVAAAMAPKAAEALIFSWMGKAASQSPRTLIDPEKPSDKALANNKPFLSELVEKLTMQVASG